MGQRSILVVEDEPLIAMMLEDFLESLGHSVTATCESVQDAMAEANKKRKIVRFLPSEKIVERWIEHAKKLPLKITY